MNQTPAEKEAEDKRIKERNERDAAEAKKKADAAATVK